MKSLKITEDWASVIIGILFTLAILTLSFFPQLPHFGPKEGWYGWEVLNSNVFTTGNTIRLILTFIYFLFFATFGSWLTGKKIRVLLMAFPIIFILSMLAQFLASSNIMKDLKLETVLFSLVIGLLIGNLIKLPNWFKQGLQSEFYIKIGLVMLGANILFSEIMRAGFYGILQSVIVVFSVWYFAFWLSKKFKIDEELGIMMASAVSICGVSAAIATAGAIKGDNKKLSYVISLVLLLAIPMMILMPLAAEWLGLTPEITGAWLGGSIDTTGAVVASGTIAGDKALEISTIVKFSQNVLLGIAAFLISIFWAYRQPKGTDKQDKPTLRIIWARFPKFVLGFIIISIFFSFFFDVETAKAAGNTIKSYRSLWFNLAFICIGMETRFKDLFQLEQGKPFYVFSLAQIFNIIVTLIVAFFVFGILYTA